jgi:hypothetical protein
LEPARAGDRTALGQLLDSSYLLLFGERYL